jgi:hypothetical protein
MSCPAGKELGVVADLKRHEIAGADGAAWPFFLRKAETGRALVRGGETFAYRGYHLLV